LLIVGIRYLTNANASKQIRMKTNLRIAQTFTFGLPIY